MAAESLEGIEAALARTGGAQRRYRLTRVIASPTVTHYRYRRAEGTAA